MKVAWIMGNNFCASTMLNYMLGNCPEVCSIGEVINIFRMKYLCSACGTPIDGCKLVSHLKDLPIDTWYRYIGDFVSSNYIVDSSKLAEWWELLLEHDILNKYDIKPILMYKDPLRNVASASIHTMAGSPSKTPEDGLKIGFDAFYMLKNVLDIVERLPKIIVVNYRDLAINPETELKKVSTSIEFPYREGMSRFWENNHHHSIAGNWGVRSAFKDNPRDIEYPKLLDPIYVERHKTIFLDNRYQDHLSYEFQDRILHDSTVRDIVKRVANLSGLPFEYYLYP